MQGFKMNEKTSEFKVTCKHRSRDRFGKNV